jgi:cytidylate kinase
VYFKNDMPKVFALFGKSCVGKSEIAKKLAQELNVPVRHCGELVKDRAEQLGVSKSDLPNAEHVAIDEETRRLAADCDGQLVVEGNFLDVVLREFQNVILVHLMCDDDERARRFASRTPNLGDALALRDEADEVLRREFYADSEESCDCALHIDTTRLTADAAALMIRTNSSTV